MSDVTQQRRNGLTDRWASEPAVAELGQLLQNNPGFKEGLERICPGAVEQLIGSSATVEALEALVDALALLVVRWEDPFLKLAPAVRGPLIRAAESLTKPFGALRSIAEYDQFIALWSESRQKFIAGSDIPGGDDVASTRRVTARLLLKEYIRRRRKMSHLEESLSGWRRAGLELKDFPALLLESLNWLDLSRYRYFVPSVGLQAVVAFWKSFKGAVCSAIALSICLWVAFNGHAVNAWAWVFALTVIAAVAALTVYLISCAVKDYPIERRLRDPIALLRYLVDKWPKGAPNIFRDPMGYEGFIQDVKTYMTGSRLGHSSALTQATYLSWLPQYQAHYANVFISYAGKWTNLAKALAEGLSGEGLSVRLDRWDLELFISDDEVESWIVESVMGCDVLVVLWSNEAARSEWVNRELEWRLRLLNVKPTISQPYLFVVNQENTPSGYPEGRIIRGGLNNDGRVSHEVLRELTLRVLMESWKIMTERLWAIWAVQHL
jgi:hypothetical protein